MKEKIPATAIAILAAIGLTIAPATGVLGTQVTDPVDRPWFPSFDLNASSADDSDQIGNVTHTYRWSAPLPVENYRRFETITLPTIPGAPVEVVAEAVDLFAEESNLTSLPIDDPATGDRETVGVALEGKVNGHPESRADLLVTDYGVYGLVNLDGMKVDYSPHEGTDGTWIQNVTLLPQADQRPADILTPTTTTQASDVSIKATHLLTPRPIEEEHPFDVALALQNTGDEPVHALIEATATNDGEQVDHQLVGPVEVVGDDVRVRNVTMALPAGTHNLTYELHTLEHTSQATPIDTVTRDVEISRSLDAEPEVYVLAFDEDGEFDDALDVNIASDTITIEAADPVDRILIHQGWLVDRLGSVTSDERWEPTSYEDESWAHIATNATAGPSTFARFNLSTDPVFTTGDKQAIEFTQRPMWISLNNEASPNDGKTPAVSLRIEDGNHDGQPIRIAKSWLHQEGMQHAVYRYPNGEQIPTERSVESEVVLAPHFSVVNLFEFDCQDCTTGDPPPYWHDETSTGRWNVSDLSISGAKSVLVKGGDGSDHKHAHRHEATYSPPELSYWAYVDNDDGQKDWHKFQWREDGTEVIKVTIRTDGSDNLEITTPDATGWVDTPFNTSEWVPVRVFNIDWSGCTFDVQLGHDIVMENQAFSNCFAEFNELRIGSKGWGAERWWVDAIKYDNGSLVKSNLKFDIAGDVVSQHSDWQQRVTDAFNQYDQIWSDPQLYIDLEISHLHGHGANIITRDCDQDPSPVDQYEEWLGNDSTRTPSNVDAYQWWTAVDMEEAGLTDECYGLAMSNTVKQSNAVSVMEGHDYSADNYDADSSMHRGLVSGHELGHVYGQEGHVSACRGVGTSDCNLMHTWDTNNRFWFTEYTKVEIWTEFYLSAEFDGLN